MPFKNKFDQVAFQKQWRLDNLERLNKRRKEKLTCECGCIVAFNNISKHRKTIKHQKKIKE